MYHDGIYTGMLLNGKLNAHLEEIDRSANEMLNLLIKQYAERERVTEELKAQDQMEWIRRMGSIRERAEETVFSELIYFKRDWRSQCGRANLFYFSANTLPVPAHRRAFPAGAGLHL